MNLNLDVLELIFAHLDGADLVASALVSRGFLAGAISSLYANIEYTLRNAKRHSVMSPFATIAAHDHLVVHVKRIAVHAAPSFPPSSHQLNPAFLNDLANTLRTATNLRSFVCAIKILPPLLPHLLGKHRLHHLRVAASLGSRQTAVLQNCVGLHSLALDYSSWTVIDALPKWTASMQRTLAHLTIFMAQDMDPTVLNTTLAQLPRLRGLHVINCPRISHSIVLKALSHTPDLNELSFSIFPCQETTLPTLNFPLPPLTHLSIDIRASYPGLKESIARIVSRVPPKEALAICGGWIGEIRTSAENTEALRDAALDASAGTGPGAPGAGAGNVGGPGHGHPHGNGNGNNHLPLLSTPVTHHGSGQPNQNAPPHNLGNQGNPPHVFGPFTFPLGNLNGNNDDDDDDGAGPQNPPDPDHIPDPNLPCLLSSLPSTLSILHLPQISPAALKEIVDHCEGLEVLGVVIGTAFASQASIKANKISSRSGGRSSGRFKYAAVPGVRPEISVLASILSCAKVLRELILDTSATDLGGDSSPDGRGGGSHGPSGTLLTATSIRMLMRESPLLRRIVGEGRVWESSTPAPSSPVPFPQCVNIELTLSRAFCGPGTGTSHVYGPPGFGAHGGGYNQMEGSNDHWFWLTHSASGGKLYSGF
ncbi:hypothetical protein JVU11DRAFT_12119 [Chiua virens]|nr:hypothetical protein JVU11DRAFT_12119 [Chiua virens]